MTQVKTGDTVRIHYRGTLQDGTQFDSSKGREPLDFEVGSGQIIPALDKALPGMAVGEAKTVAVPAQAAVGGRSREVFSVVAESGTGQALTRVVVAAVKSLGVV